MSKQKEWWQNENFIYSLLANNGYQTLTPHVRSIGFKMSALRYNERERLPHLAEDFLLNSNFKRNDPEIELSISSYLTDDGMKMVALTDTEDTSAYENILLGEHQPLDIALGEAIVRRRSIRDFTGDPIAFENLTTLLRATAGVSASAKIKLSDGSSVDFNLRTVPSGGGLYPIELVILALNVKEMARGIYRYQPLKDNLIKLGDESLMQQLLRSFSGALDMVAFSHPSLIFLYIAKPWCSMRKYGNRGLRFVFHEVGGMTQNLHLTATGLGLGSTDCASFFEDEANAVFNFDGVYQTALHATLIGTIA